MKYAKICKNVQDRNLNIGSKFLFDFVDILESKDFK